MLLLKVKSVGLLVGAASFFLSLAAPYLIYAAGDGAKSSGEIIVEVPNNSSLGQIALLLEQKGVIANAFVFKVLAYLTGNSKNLKRGTYKFQSGESLFEVLEDLKTGSELMVKVTIPEGLRRAEIYSLLRQSDLENQGQYESAEKVSKLMEVIQEKFPEAKNPEGFLFPDTYFFVKTQKESDILIAMAKNLFSRLPESFFSEEHPNRLTPYKTLILASIIEKETGDSSERGKISSVFHNRLAKGIPLQTDPTVIYGIKNFDGNLRRVHLRTLTPFNTYLIKGLTPTPISNPGLDSIMAALNPEKTKYFYFVAKGDGTSYFSKNLSEHNRAVRKYQLNRSKNYRSH